MPLGEQAVLVQKLEVGGWPQYRSSGRAILTEVERAHDCPSWPAVAERSTANATPHGIRPRRDRGIVTGSDRVHGFEWLAPSLASRNHPHRRPGAQDPAIYAGIVNAESKFDVHAKRVLAVPIPISIMTSK